MNENFWNGLGKVIGFIAGASLFLALIMFALGDSPTKEEFKDTVYAAVGVNADVSVCAFEKVDLAHPYDGDYLIAYRETVTDVLYLRYCAGYKGGLTVMLNPSTGLPLTYSDYLALSLEVQG